MVRRDSERPAAHTQQKFTQVPPLPPPGGSQQFTFVETETFCGVSSHSLSEK